MTGTENLDAEKGRKSKNNSILLIPRKNVGLDIKDTEEEKYVKKETE